MKHLFSTALLVLALAWPSVAHSQATGRITGVVRDVEGEALPGANVVIEGTTRGAAADVDGRYTITSVPAGTVTLVASSIGYRRVTATVTVPAGGEVTRDFRLEEDRVGLEEVVVTGIASETSRARSEVAVGRVDAEAFVDAVPYQDLSQLLGGKVAGVNIQPSSGNVGGGIRFNIRSGGGLNGQGQPVIYVDGVRVDNAEIQGFGVGGQGVGALSDLNPEDIESIDVLKGPAGAALYGTSGSNGVVLITTKRGRRGAGAGLAIEYKGVGGYNERAQKYTTGNNANLSKLANDFFRRGAIQQHTLNASGSAGAVRYFAGIDTRSEDGHLPGNSADRTSFRANFDATPTSVLSLGASAGFTRNDIARPQNDNNIFGILGNSVLADTPFIFTDSLAVIGIRDNTRTNRFTGSLNASYFPIAGLRFNGIAGFDGSELRQDQTFPAELVYSGTTNGQRGIFNRRNEQFTFQGDGAYSYTLGGVRLTTTAGFQGFDRRLRTAFQQKENFPTGLVTNIGAGATLIASDEDFQQERSFGLFAQQEADIQGRYLLTLGVRRDYASSVGLEAPSIYYPKASAAILVDQFAFVPNAIGLLKLRAAYGETGQLPNSLDAVSRRFGSEPGGFGPGAVLAVIGNREIEPERIRELELGLDAEVGGRLGLELTYYMQRAKDSIIGFENAPSTGETSNDVPFNVGGIEGNGLETNLSYSALSSTRTALDFNVIFNLQRNKVTDLGGAQPIFDGFDVNVIQENLSRSAFFTTKVLGAEFDADGAYTGPLADTGRTYIGTPFPITNGSFSTTLRVFKNATLFGLVDFAAGHRIFNNTRVFQVQFGNDRDYNALSDQLFGTEDVDPTLTPGTAEYRAAAERFARLDPSFDANFIEKADFLKLREISLRYDFGDVLRRYTNTFRSLSLGVSGRNLLTSTRYSGPDPEVNFDGSRSLSRGQDFLTLQNPRQVYFTLSVGL